ncbi:pirin family protein [Halobaculum sp. CBA1158]|uniref:pirin family protein n=1 Tax=Halobaculum sp. CBA1158 TaxID=2904243 RepID=UPI001F42CA1E|nr:pirin family protein [Halobaculum sp. CBA1158]UIO98816.1 pirin family protein [Halobaculum sp. CBA1158]
MSGEPPDREDDGSQGVTGVVPGGRVRHGTGVNSTRAFPTESYPHALDPFVLFERFYIDPDQGFPMHPHRGFEIVSYMLDGGMDHEDSLGVAHTAREGDAMRITTGGGIRHSEFPAGDAGCNGLQLWVNLPRDLKEIDADYADADAAALPTTEHDGATVTTVLGEGSPLELHTPVEYRDVRVDDAWTWTVPDGWSGFVFGVAGAGTVDGDPLGVGDVLPLPEARAVELVADDGVDGPDATTPTTPDDDDDPFRVVCVAGRPHGEPIRQRGPYVL